MPNVISTTANGTAVYPISDALLSKRKLFLTEQVDAESMNTLLQELMYLEQTEPGKEITLFINSPGGECLSGLAVADYIKMMKSPVRTVCTGTAASMGAILFLCGKKPPLRLQRLKIGTALKAARNAGCAVRYHIRRHRQALKEHTENNQKGQLFRVEGSRQIRYRHR